MLWVKPWNRKNGDTDQAEIIGNLSRRWKRARDDFRLSSSGFRTRGKAEWWERERERQSNAHWRAGGALAQFRLMSGQLEVHHTALCTAPVSLNLCCRGPYPQLGHSPREALTLRPYCFDSCTHLEVMQNVIVMYTQWPCTLVSVKNKYTCVQN